MNNDFLSNHLLLSVIRFPLSAFRTPFFALWMIIKINLMSVLR